jgi:ferredoxin-2, mitochondrial
MAVDIIPISCHFCIQLHILFTFLKAKSFFCMDIINIYVEDKSGNRQHIEIPTDINLNLMEVLKASEYPVLGTCGGMALCATCHVEVLEGDNLNPPQDQELDMLDTLPAITSGSRLACQIPVRENIDGLVVRIMTD